METYYRTVKRLKGYDYSNSGIYFVSFNTKGKENSLWLFTDDLPEEQEKAFPEYLSFQGILLDEGIRNIEKIYPTITVLNYAVLANHAHLLLLIEEKGINLSRIIKQLKSFATKACKTELWQDGFSDRIIRNEKELALAWRYIEGNKKNVLETHVTTDIEEIFKLNYRRENV